MGQGVEESYSTFRSQLEAGNVGKVTIRGDRISGTSRSRRKRRSRQASRYQYTQFVTYVPSFGDNSLLPLLQSQKVDIVTEPAEDFAFWREVLAGMLPFLILIGLVYISPAAEGVGGRHLLLRREPGPPL